MEAINTVVTQLDCGHAATPDGFAAGYARDSVTDTTMCYECAARVVRNRVRSLEAVTVYAKAWNPAGHHDARNRVQFVTWDGTVLGWGFRSQVDRYATRVHYSGTIEGVKLHGWGPAQSGDYVTLRPYKRQ